MSMKMNEDEIYDMSVKETEIKPREAMVEQKFHPGFKCFFQDFLTRNSMTFKECYRDLIDGSRVIDDLKMPIEKVLRMDNIENEERKHILAAKGDHLLYFYKNDHNKLEGTLLNGVAV